MLVLALLVARALAEAPAIDTVARPVGAEVEQTDQCVAVACAPVLRAACVGGDFVACATLGRTLLNGWEWESLPEARDALGRACEGAALECSVAASALHDSNQTSLEVRARQRHLLGIGCEAGDATACADLAASWQMDPGADLTEVRRALDRVRTLGGGYATLQAIAMLSGSAVEAQQGLSMLTQLVRDGNRAAADALVAIRWGGRDNLPLPLATTLKEGCGGDCASFASSLAEGPQP